MATGSLETDYLVVGAGAMGMAFTDALDRPRRRPRHPRRPSPRRRRPLARRLPVRAAAPGVAVLRRRVDRARDRRGAAERPGGGAPGTGPPVGDPGLLRRRPAPPPRRLGSGAASSAAASTAPTARPHLVTSRVSGETVEVDVRRRVVDATYLSPTIPATTPPPFGVADDVAVVPINELADAGRGADRLRHRRFRQDRHRRHRVAARQRRRAGPHRVGPPARPLDAQPGGRPARSRRGPRAGRRHHRRGRRRRVARRPVPPARSRRRDAADRPGRRPHHGQDADPRPVGARAAPHRSSTSSASATSGT